MTFREAGTQEAARIAAFLRLHLFDAMFPLANMQNYGMGREGRYQMRFWLAESGGAITGAVGLSGMGMILPALPRGPAKGLRRHLSGTEVAGIIGRPAWVAAVLDDMRLPAEAVGHDADEPGFAMTLADLILPADPALTLHRPTLADRPLMVRWRADYHGEVLGTPPFDRDRVAANDIDAYLARDSHRLLLHGGVPVAMTGFNAILPDAVQIGGVYTPPDHRGRGFARAAVALHLDEARRSGVDSACLFAANEAAARAYLAIGFQPRARTRMILFRTPQRIAA